METEVGAGIFMVFMFVIIFLIFFLLVVGGIYLITSFIYKKLFEKANRNGLHAFIPIYRDYVLIELGEMNWYWILAMYAPLIVGILASFIPFVGTLATGALSIISLIAKINIYYNVCKKYKTEDWFVVIVAIVPIIGLAIIAFSDKFEYHPEVEVKPDGFFGDFGFIKNEEVKQEVKPEVKPEPVKVTEEEIKETKQEEVKEATVEEPKKPTKKKPNNKKKEDK